jgi:hypothetical protein
MNYADKQFQEMKACVRAGLPGRSSQSEGWGDRLHKVLGPIGRAIHWPCLKGDGTTDLKPSSLCGYFRITLNKL